MSFAQRTKVAEFNNTANQGLLTLGLLQALYALINIIIIRLLLSIVGNEVFG
jgi:hypothetical protein